MIEDETFENRLSAMRPRLHRFCARMVGSAIDGEDLVQDVLFRALSARAAGAEIGNLEAWLLRVAQNASLDLIRQRAKATLVPLDDDVVPAPDAMPRPEIAALGFRTFMQLPPLQRCAVVLKDVLGHSVEDIAGIAGCSHAAAKSALQRGRKHLAERAAQDRTDILLPLMTERERRRLLAYVDAFRTGELDAIRRMLSDDVKVDLVNRLQLRGRERASPYFTRYEEARHWRFAPGAVDGHPVMLVYHADSDPLRPAHFVLIDWRDEMVVGIRDFLFAPYALEGAGWVRLD